MKRIEVDESVFKNLQELARILGTDECDAIRRAVDDLLSKPAIPTNPDGDGTRSHLDAFREAGLAGCLAGLPPDLSANEHYFQGLGGE